MASRNSSRHQLTTARSTHGSSPLSSSSSGPRQHHSGYRPSKRNSSATDHPKWLQSPCSGMRSPHDDRTDVVLATEDHCMLAPRSQPWNWTTSPYDAVVPSPQDWKPRFQATRYLEDSPSSQSPQRVRYGDLDHGRDGRDRLLTPPRTPQLSRLESPELEPLVCTGAFCDCCSDEKRYYDERGKMDSQIESALAHIRGPHAQSN